MNLPGSNGLPLLGETLAFAKNPFRFIEQRLAAHGRMFRTSVLGRKAVVLAGADAAGRFIDSSVVMREGSMPPHVQELFGGRSLPLLDGDAHKTRKGLVLQAFTRAAVTAYLPILQQTIERYFEAWTLSGEIRWLDELKKLSIEVICSAIIGMKPGDEMDQLRHDYGELTAGFATLPINLPGTKYRKALQARDRILAVLRAKVRERRQTPAGDGLSRILAAAPREQLSDDDAALELHHIVIAGFIVFAEIGAIVQMPYLSNVVNEVRRLCPIIPAVFGKTKEGFEFEGVQVPAGWMVMWAVTSSHVAHGVYSDPEKFDPDRFAPERAEDKRHEHAYAPQGAGPVTGHRCPGFDFATYFMAVFAIVLLRRYTWQFAAQDFTLDYSKTPPEQRDGLRATVRLAAN